MIRKHVDLIAIGVLLGGIALYSSARDAMVVTVVSHKRITFSPRCRPPVVTAPEIRRILSYARD